MTKEWTELEICWESPDPKETIIHLEVKNDLLVVRTTNPKTTYLVKPLGNA